VPWAWLGQATAPLHLLREDELGSEWAELTPHDSPDGSSVTVCTSARTSERSSASLLQI